MLFNIYQYYHNMLTMLILKNDKLHILTCLNIFLTYYFIQSVSYFGNSENIKL